MSRRHRLAPAAFALLSIAVAMLLAGYVAWTRSGSRATSGARPDVGGPEAVAALSRRPFVLFRTTALGGAYGRVALAPLDAPNGSRAATTLSCDRVHFAGGHGVCLTASRGVVTTYRAVTFDDTFAARHEIPLPGVPSRVRVAPDGLRAGITVFVNGDSYAAGNFSTRTLIIETVTGRVLGDLEGYAVTHDGRPLKAADFNFWGVTFADANRFYATLGTGGHTYLVEGDVNARQVRTLRDGVECPSLSPDHTRIVFKKRVITGVRLVWRIGVIDLATMQETLVAESRSVDDQAEWLDGGHVVYSLPSETRAASTDVWVAPADGTGSPHVLVEDAWSPAFVRSATSDPSRTVPTSVPTS